MKEKFVISIISQFTIQLSTAISNYFLILFLDVDLMGIWALANSIVNLSLMFIDLGLTSIHYQYAEKKNFDEYFGSFLVIKIFLILINIFLSLILLIIFGLWGTEYLIIIILLLISNLIFSTLNIFITHLRGKLKVFKVEIPSFFISISQSIAKLYIIFNISVIINPLFWICIILIFFNILYAAIIAFIGFNEFKLKKPNKLYLFEYLKDTKPLMIFTILSVITTNLGNIILGHSFDNETLAYFYIVSGYILPMISIITSSLISLCTPLYSVYLAENDFASIKKIVQTTEKYVSIIILCIIILIFLIGDKIFLIFLPNYLKSLPILYILIFYSYLEGINRNYAILLISSKKQKLSAYISIFLTTFRLLLFFILIPKTFLSFEMLGLGTLGYILALIIPLIIFTVVIRVLNKKFFNLNLQKKLLLHAPIAFITILSMLLMKNYFLENLIQSDVILIIILAALALPIFIILLFISKNLTKKDIQFFFELLKISRYKKSMKDEFQKNDT